MSSVPTGLKEEVLQHIGQTASSVPLDDFKIHPGQLSGFEVDLCMGIEQSYGLVVTVTARPHSGGVEACRRGGLKLDQQPIT